MQSQQRCSCGALAAGDAALRSYGLLATIYVPPASGHREWPSYEPEVGERPRKALAALSEIPAGRTQKGRYGSQAPTGGWAPPSARVAIIILGEKLY